jgi:hypothetical protein
LQLGKKLTIKQKKSVVKKLWMGMAWKRVNLVYRVLWKELSRRESTRRELGRMARLLEHPTYETTKRNIWIELETARGQKNNGLTGSQEGEFLVSAFCSRKNNHDMSLNRVQRASSSKTRFLHLDTAGIFWMAIQQIAP